MISRHADFVRAHVTLILCLLACLLTHMSHSPTTNQPGSASERKFQRRSSSPGREGGLSVPGSDTLYNRVTEAGTRLYQKVESLTASSIQRLSIQSNHASTTPSNMPERTRSTTPIESLLKESGWDWAAAAVSSRRPGNEKSWTKDRKILSELFGILHVGTFYFSHDLDLTNTQQRAINHSAVRINYNEVGLVESSLPLSFLTPSTPILVIPLVILV